MRIPAYWAKSEYTGQDSKGKQLTFNTFGWSNDSIEDARQHAYTRAQQTFEKVTQNKAQGCYEYLDIPLREEIIDTLTIDNTVEALITRNRYGSLVLNTSRVLFVDVDLPQKAFSGPGIFKRLFGKKEDLPKPEELELQKIRDWASQNRNYSFIIYRTFAGFRLLFTDKTYTPESDEVQKIFNELKSDRLYQILCKKQESFRARLTPKPWRIDVRLPGAIFSKYPYESDELLSISRNWVSDYEAASVNHSVCRFIEQIGNPPSTELIKAIVNIHDQYTCVEEKPLA